MRKTLLLLIITLFFSASAAAQSGRKITAPPPRPAEPVIEEPAEQRTYAPPAELTTLPERLLNRELTALDKSSFRLSDFKGKVVVLNLWATWCGPCRMDVPEYESVRKEYAGRDVEFIALTTEDPYTASDRVKRFVREFKFGFRVAWADPDTARTLMNGRNAIPQTLVIGADGRIVDHWRGYARGSSGDHLRLSIDNALSETTASASKSQ
jgi:thiol-disulfide isomerase/thioredoxin